MVLEGMEMDVMQTDMVTIVAAELILQPSILKCRKRGERLVEKVAKAEK